jgi:hypothetical protein
MQCPQCGVDIPDQEWNCKSCRINVYWATQHYEELARIREQQGAPVSASTPPFLIRTHQDALDDRAGRGGRVEHKVRTIARLVMRRNS